MSITSIVLTADGSSSTFTFQSARAIGLFIEGTLGGGSVQPQISHDGSTWHNYGSAISATGASKIDTPPCKFKLVLSGSTSPNTTITVTE